MFRTQVVSLARPCVKGSCAQAHTPLRHPKGLYVICVTVGLERFSFFLLSAILVLYLTERLGVPANLAVAVYSYFLCGSYLLPLIGGRLCDGRMGFYRTALLGGALQAVGYVMLFIERVMILYAALTLMSIGSGLFKAGTQSIVARLYACGDSRREAGFSVLYTAVNVGALCAPLLGGWAQAHAGWTRCFMLASLGALLSVSVLMLGDQGAGGASSNSSVEMKVLPTVPLRLAQRRLALLLFAGVVFAAGSVQSHSSLLLWARDSTDRSIGSLAIPVACFAAAPAALVLLVGLPLSAMYSALRPRHLEPSTIRKVALGLAVSGLTFVPLWIASTLVQSGRRLSPLWVLGCMTLMALSELLVPALAPAEITGIASQEQQGRWLSYWFLAMAAGNLVGGLVHF